MTNICSKCLSTITYDSYFKKYICRNCGHTEEYKSPYDLAVETLVAFAVCNNKTSNCTDCPRCNNDNLECSNLVTEEMVLEAIETIKEHND